MKQPPSLQPLEDTGCGAHEPYTLRVLGDSMEPEFPDGVVIVIDPSGAIESGSYVIAESKSQEYIFRQLLIQNKRYFLNPLNTGYPTIEIEGLHVIKGVIIQKAGTRRSHRKHYL